MVYYYNPIKSGLIKATALGDGYSIHLEWNKAYLNNRNFKLAYHIYMSIYEDRVFSEGVKFISIDGSTSVDIYDLTPGQLYHFAVRAIEYDPVLINVNQLPRTFNGLLVYPESLLRDDISSTSILIPLIDTETFPSQGIVKVGVELINYLSVDNANNNLILTNANLQRGFYNTLALLHTTDGYDGYSLWDSVVSFLLGKEETNTKIFPCQSCFDDQNYAFTIPDGYHQEIKDLLTSDLSGSDDFNQDFPAYDYSGLHRTNPVDLLSGLCVGSYIGGEMFCADGYTGVGRQVRGLSLQDQNNQRQEFLLNVTGEPMCLIKKVWTGITCSCFMPTSEFADARCPKCYGSKYVVGWEQFFNPRRSDGRILVRVSPYDDDIKLTENGYESDALLDCWTLTVPTIKDRDILVRFDQDGNEEFRYEVLSVNRNKTALGLQGAQKFKMQRIRKYDPAYQIKVFRNTATLPSKVNTGLGSTTGIPPHTHEIVIVQDQPLSNASQLTNVAHGHNHIVTFQNGQLVVEETLGHTHQILL